MNQGNRPLLKIAILGTRGIPARYGGFETFAEELSTRLVERGHQVTVYGRRKFGESADQSTFRGVQRVLVPTVAHKYLETPLHGLMSFIDLFRRKLDVVILCNAANSPFAFVVKIRGLPLLINVDGIERQRGKWNFLGKLWYRVGEIASVLFATRVIADAEVIADYYREQYRITPEVITYGGKAVRREEGELLRRFGLRARSYILYVSRLEPENNALGVIQAYMQLRTELPLVIVGDAPYAEEYKKLLRAAAGPKVIFTGFQFGEAYQEFQSNCYLYIQATEVGGTHPALVEAMAYGNCVVANQTPENVEVLGDAGYFYPKNNFEKLTEVLAKLLQDQSLVENARTRAKLRAEQQYSWDRITTQYEELCATLASRAHSATPLATD